MIKLLRKKKFRREVELLEKKMLEVLEPSFPNLIENHKNWDLYSCLIHENPKQIQLLHQTFSEKTNNIGQGKNFKINGLKILHKKTKSRIDVEILVYSNTIQFIQLPFKKSIIKEFEINSISATELETSILSIQNDDQDIVEKILKNYKPEVKERFEISDAFEIELNGKQYFTILDMEDGNYIAINKDGKVFRLIHDNEEPVKEIAKSIMDLKFNGDKKELMTYFRAKRKSV